MSEKSDDIKNEWIKKIDDLLIDAGVRLFEINMTLDSMIKDLLFSEKEILFESEMQFPYQKESGYDLYNAKGIYWDNELNSAVILTEDPQDKILWQNLNIAIKDLMANAIVLKLTANSLYLDYKKH
jgi:hypothetical protein